MFTEKGFILQSADTLEKFLSVVSRKRPRCLKAVYLEILTVVRKSACSATDKKKPTTGTCK